MKKKEKNKKANRNGKDRGVGGFSSCMQTFNESNGWEFTTREKKKGEFCYADIDLVMIQIFQTLQLGKDSKDDQYFSLTYMISIKIKLEIKTWI